MPATAPTKLTLPLRFRKSARSSFSIGPSLPILLYDSDENKGRFINNVDEIGSYDSATTEKEKWHVGITANYTRDKRSNPDFSAMGEPLSMYGCRRLTGLANMPNHLRSLARN